MVWDENDYSNAANRVVMTVETNYAQNGRKYSGECRPLLAAAHAGGRLRPAVPQPRLRCDLGGVELHVRRHALTGVEAGPTAAMAGASPAIFVGGRLLKPPRAEHLDAELLLQRAAEAVFHLRAFIGRGRRALVVGLGFDAQADEIGARRGDDRRACSFRGRRDCRWSRPGGCRRPWRSRHSRHCPG